MNRNTRWSMRLVMHEDDLDVISYGGVMEVGRFCVAQCGVGTQL
jgi:hypothetical protein